MSTSRLLFSVLITVGVLAGTPACSLATPELQETRQLETAVEDGSRLAIDAGAGSLYIEGRADIARVQVTAEIYQSNPNDDYTLRLALDAQGRALLEAHAGGGWAKDRIDLSVLVPAGVAVDIDDGSGSISASGLAAGLVIVDGSGSIDLENLSGDVRIEDGSGSIQVHRVSGGDLRIEDGSGSIRVEDVDGDVHVTDGSGSLTVHQVSGKVTVSDGSGSIEVVDAGGFELLEDGSGSVATRNVDAESAN